MIGHHLGEFANRRLTFHKGEEVAHRAIIAV